MALASRLAACPGVPSARPGLGFHVANAAVGAACSRSHAAVNAQLQPCRADATASACSTGRTTGVELGCRTRRRRRCTILQCSRPEPYGPSNDDTQGSSVRPMAPLGEGTPLPPQHSGTAAQRPSHINGSSGDTGAGAGVQPPPQPQLQGPVGGGVGAGTGSGSGAAGLRPPRQSHVTAAAALDEPLAQPQHTVSHHHPDLDGGAAAVGPMQHHSAQQPHAGLVPDAGGAAGGSSSSSGINSNPTHAHTGGEADDSTASTSPLGLHDGSRDMHVIRVGLPNQLPPLKLDFLRWRSEQQEQQQKQQQELQPQQPHEGKRPGAGQPGSTPRRGGAARRRRTQNPAAAAQQADDFVRQTVMSCRSLVQLKSAVAQYHTAMGATTAAVALSRLCALALQEQRARTRQAVAAAAGLSLGRQERPPMRQADGGGGAGGAMDEAQGGDDPAASAPVADGTAAPGASPAALRAATGQGPAAAAAAATAPPAQRSPAASSGSSSPSGVEHWRLPPDDQQQSGDSVGSAARGSAASPAGVRSGDGAQAGPGPQPPPPAAQPQALLPSPQRAAAVSGLNRDVLFLVRLLLHRVANRVTAGPLRAPARGGAPGMLPAAGGDHRAKVVGLVLSSLARLQPPLTDEDQAALRAMLAAAKPDLFLATPQQLARLAASIPMIPGLLPDGAWLDHFANVAQSKFYACGPEHFASIAWSLARLGHRPGELWLHSFVMHTERHLPATSAADLCQIVWALNQFSFRPDDEWSCDVLEALERYAAEEGSDFGAPAGLRTGSSSAAAAAATDPAAGTGPSAGSNASARDLASLLLWVARAGLSPGADVIDACLQRIRPHVASLGRVHTLRLLLALSELRNRPPHDLLTEMLAAVQPKLPLLSVGHLTQLLVAVADLQYLPSQEWIVAFLRASRMQLRKSTRAHVAHICATFKVFARWQLKPSRAYLMAVASYTDSVIDKFGCKNTASLLYSMASLMIKPQHKWLVHALEALGNTLPSSPLQPPGSSTTGSGAGGGGGADGQSATGSSSSSSSKRPRHGGNSHHHHHVHEALAAHHTAANAVATACYSLSNLVELQALQPELVAPAAAPQPSVAQGPDGAPSDPGKQQPTPAVALLPYEIWTPLKAILDRTSRVLLGVMSAQDLFRLVVGLSRVNFYPGRDFLRLHAAATARLGAQLLPAEKDQITECYSRLAAAAPAMAAEARRQSGMRQAKASVLLGEPA